MTENTNARENDTVEPILADFRDWLCSHSVHTEQPSPSPSETVDLFTLLAQFTALRHEVNLQTRAMRTATEQVGEVLKRTQEADAAATVPDASAALLPFAKVILDIADALLLSLRQVEKARDSAHALLAGALSPADVAHQTDEAAPQPRGFWKRVFGGSSPPASPPAAPSRSEDLAKLQTLLASVADGYTLSLRRVERALPQFELEIIETAGMMFDPEWMEAVEVVDGEGLPSGTVIAEIRRGYRRQGRPFRFALVKVAR